MPAQLASYGCEYLVTTRCIEFDLPCNWKLYIENAMEEYHLPYVHKTTLELLEMNHGIIETKGNWDAIREKHEGTRALLEEDADKGFPNIATLEGPPAEGTHYVVLYPSTMLGMTLDSIWYLELQPQGPNHTKVIHGACFPSESVTREDFEAKVQYYYKRWDTTLDEDNSIAALQQRGLGSPFARPGRFSHLEPLVPELAKWWINHIIPED